MIHKLTLLLSLTLAGAALAADASKGSTLFFDHCASCHTASRDAVERAHQAPDLVRVLKTRDAELLNRWMLEPSKRTKDTACDTKALRGNPEAVADVWAYLQSNAEAAPLPRAERRKAQLTGADLTLWRNRKRGER